jgi:protein-S-isoprenylcysteine O-methyltransferase Ste14
MNPTFPVLLIVFILSLIIRTSYELLKKAGKADPASKPLFIVILTVMCALWMSWFGMCPQDPWQFALPSWIKFAGFGLFILGLVLALVALFQLRGVENIDHLVTTGLFRLVRHPMYLGFILWILGWAVYHGAIISFMAGLLGIISILYWQQLEDQHLTHTFGEEYLLYRKSTWF